MAIKPTAIFLGLLAILTTVFGFSPPTIEWSECNGLKTRKLLNQKQQESLRIYDPSLSLDEFKKLFIKNSKETNQPQGFPSFRPKLPTTNEEWAIAKAAYASAQCAWPKLPLIWDDPSNDKSLTVFVIRFLAKKDQPGKAQLWLLAGGPGDESGVLADFASSNLMEQLNGDVDIYLAEQRGVGRSEHLECSNGKMSKFKSDLKKIKACVDEMNSKYGTNGLFGFSARNFAHDIYYISQNSKPAAFPTQKVIIYGFSYGTFLVNEALSQFPNYFDGAVADSAVSLTQPWEYRDLHYLDTLEEIIQSCEKNSFCTGKFQSLSTTPRSAFLSVLTKQPKCHAKLTVEQLRTFIIGAGQSLNYRKLLMPLIYRLYRCNYDNDSTFINNFYHLIGKVIDVDNDNDRLLNQAKASDGTSADSDVYYFVTLGDLCSKTVTRTVNDYESFYNSAPPYGHFPFQGFLETYHIMQMYGGKYNNSYGFSYATSYKKPLLLLHSTLDGKTPKKMGEEWIKVFSESNPNFHYFMFKNSLHWQICSTAMASFAKDNPAAEINCAKDTCGGQIFVSFIKSMATSGLTTMADIKPTLNSGCFDNQQYYEAVEPDFEKITTLDDPFRVQKIKFMFDFPDLRHLFQYLPFGLSGVFDKLFGVLNLETLNLWDDTPRFRFSYFLFFSFEPFFFVVSFILCSNPESFLPVTELFIWCLAMMVMCCGCAPCWCCLNCLNCWYCSGMLTTYNLYNEALKRIF